MERIVNEAPRESFMSRDEKMRSSVIENRQNGNINRSSSRRDSNLNNTR